MTSSSAQRSPGFGKADAAAMAAFLLLTTAAAGTIGVRYLPLLLRWRAFNFWFDGDAALIVRLIADRQFDYDITNHHPLFLLLTHAPRVVITRLTGIAPETAATLVASMAAGLLTALTYLLLRGLDLVRLEACVFTALVTVTAAAVFWFPIPDFAVFGACTVVAAFTALAWWERGVRVPRSVIFAGAAATLTFTTTNFMAGGLVLAARFRLALAAALATGCVAVVLAGSTIQAQLFPHARILYRPQGFERGFILSPDAGGEAAIARAFAAHAVVMPEFQVAHRSTIRELGHISAQRVPLGSGGPLVVAGQVLWLSLLAAGLAWVVAHRLRSRTAVTLTAYLLGQLALHSIFGIETFLYSLHWVVPLIAVAALGVRHPGRWGRTVLYCAAVAVLVIGTSNVAAVQRAFTLLVENDLRYPNWR